MTITSEIGIYENFRFIPYRKYAATAQTTSRQYFVIPKTAIWPWTYKRVK